MSLFVLDAILWIFGIRAGRSESFAANTGALMRVLAAVAMSVVFLSLVLWAAVWLSIRLL